MIIVWANPPTICLHQLKSILWNMNHRTSHINQMILRNNQLKKMFPKNLRASISLLLKARVSLRVRFVRDLVLMIQDTDPMINLNLIVANIGAIVVGRVVDLSIENAIMIGANNIKIITIIIIISIILI